MTKKRRSPLPPADVELFEHEGQQLKILVRGASATALCPFCAKPIGGGVRDSDPASLVFRVKHHIVSHLRSCGAKRGS